MSGKRQLPRLDPERYRGYAHVFWTYTMEARATGWLSVGFHHAFRELLLHSQSRYRISCPIYVLMPDHMHFIWIGASLHSDQLKASTFLRKQLNAYFRPVRLQRQPHDHVLKEEERARGRFVDAVDYVRKNPERAALVEAASKWQYQGAIIPGYPDLKYGTEDFWDRFWRSHHAYQASSV